MVKESGPGALEVPDALIASRTSSGVKMANPGSSGWACLSVRLRRLESRLLEKPGTFVNCTQKALAMQSLEECCFSPKRMG